MFESLLTSINEQGGSVRAYDACARAARARIAAEPDKAAALFLIAIAAQRFVDSYDDQPLTVEAAGAELARFGSYIEALDGAYSQGAAAARLDALNEVAARLAEAAKA